MPGALRVPGTEPATSSMPPPPPPPPARPSPATAPPPAGSRPAGPVSRCRRAREMAGQPSALNTPVRPHMTLVTSTASLPANGTVAVPIVRRRTRLGGGQHQVDALVVQTLQHPLLVLHPQEQQPARLAAAEPVGGLQVGHHVRPQLAAPGRPVLIQRAGLLGQEEAVVVGACRPATRGRSRPAGAGVGQRGRRLAHDRGQLGAVCSKKNRSASADRHSRDAASERVAVALDRHRGRARVVRRGPRHHLQRERTVAHRCAPSARSGRGRAQRLDAGQADPAEGRLEADDAAHEAGQRIDPPVSVPGASATMPAATAAPEPPLDPPGTRVGSCGFRQPPNQGFWQVVPQASSCVFSLAMQTAPADVSRATTSASRPGTWSR